MNLKELIDGSTTAERIKMLMVKRKETQELIARTMGISVMTLRSRFNDGKWELIELGKLAKHFGVELKELIGKQ